MPSRRILLRTFGGALLAGTAGCLGDGTPEGSATTEWTATETTAGTDPTTRGTEATAGTDSTTRSEPPAVREVDPSAVASRGVPEPGVDSAAHEPFRAFAVGTRDGVANPDDNLPHGFWVWNDTDETQTVEVTLATGGTTLLDDAYEIPVREALGVELREPRAYEWTVRHGDREKAEDIPRRQFDCNRSATDVIVRDAEIKRMTITTELACRTATNASEDA